MVIEKGEAGSAVMANAMSDGFKEEGVDLLFSHYKRMFKGKRDGAFKQDCSALWDAVQPLDGQLFLMACKRHVIDHTLADEGRNNGDWFPTAANIKRHAHYAHQERMSTQANQKSQQAKELRQRVPLGAEMKIIPLTDPYLITALGKKFIECIPDDAYSCSMCGDTGMVIFYYYLEKREHVFTSKEWVDMHSRAPEKADLFRCHNAVCDQCDVGIALWAKYDEVDPRFKPPNYWDIKRLVARRKKKRKEIIRQKDLSEGEQIEVEQQ